MADYFDLTDRPIDPAPLLARIDNPSTGAVVTFVGRVRDHNRDRPVVRLEYEGSPKIAGHEFLRIAGEARAKFDVAEIAAVHRVGSLDIGDIAVWIGVSSTHRAAAFGACRYLIDELKNRLPIWKKEHYPHGATEWLEGG